MSRGVGSGLYSAPGVKTQADIVVASAATKPAHLLKVAYNMGKIAKKEGDTSYFTPYLKVAVEKTEGVEDEKVQKMRSNLLPEYALLVKNDVEQAVAYKKASFAQAAEPKNWLENANMLNNFAWWCFENQINLAEAEKFARQGIELAKPGRQKANILDTLAEVCNLKGDCGSAVEYIKLAVAEDPENDYFQKQLERFEALLADAHGARE
jgi:tetratricopeptide (TPR) repeat protein